MRPGMRLVIGTWKGSAASANSWFWTAHAFAHDSPQNTLSPMRTNAFRSFTRFPHSGSPQRLGMTACLSPTQRRYSNGIITPGIRNAIALVTVYNLSFAEQQSREISSPRRCTRPVASRSVSLRHQSPHLPLRASWRSVDRAA